MDLDGWNENVSMQRPIQWVFSQHSPWLIVVSTLSEGSAKGPSDICIFMLN